MMKLLIITAGVTFLLTSAVSAGEGAAGHHNNSLVMPMDNMKNDSSHHQQMMQGHAHSMGSLAGMPGNKKDVARVIHVEANDSMRFMHEPFNIKDGETIKFIVINKG